jgi:similar to stage IV sporulation protein
MSASMRFFAGCVKVRATGAQVERLINLAASNGIVLRNVRRETSRSLVFEVDYRSFFAMRIAFRSTGCHIRILRREGVPHLRSRLSRRAAFVVGAVACFILLMGLMQVVWGVRIVGEMDIEQRAIAQEILDGMGMRPGILRDRVDAQAISAALEENLGGLTFAGARMRGLILEVEIVPQIEQPEMPAHDTPADIVADRAGTVERIMVLEGTAAVQVGQQVREGDVLIHGRAVGPGGYIDVHALGEVMIRTWTTGEGEAPLRERVTRPTGRYQNRATLLILGQPLPVHGDAPFEEYAVASRETQILPGLYLPASLLTETLHETQTTFMPREEDEVRREAEQSAYLAALNKLPKDTTIVDKRVEYSKMKDTTLRAAVSLQTLETIGVERERAAWQ